VFALCLWAGYINLSCSSGGTLAERSPDSTAWQEHAVPEWAESCCLGKTIFFFKLFFQFHMQTIPARKETKWPVERSGK